MTAGRREPYDRSRIRIALREAWAKSDPFFFLVVTAADLLAIALLAGMSMAR